MQDGDYSAIVACPECLHAVVILAHRPEAKDGRADVFGRCFYGETFDAAVEKGRGALEQLKHSLGDAEWHRLYGTATFQATELP